MSSREEAVIAHAKGNLGFETESDIKKYRWLVEESLSAELPYGWKATSDAEGRTYWHNSKGVSSWQHPADSEYRAKYLELKRKEQDLDIADLLEKRLVEDAEHGTHDGKAEDEDDLSEDAANLDDFHFPGGEGTRNLAEEARTWSSANKESAGSLQEQIQRQKEKQRQKGSKTPRSAAHPLFGGAGRPTFSTSKTVISEEAEAVQRLSHSLEEEKRLRLAAEQQHRAHESMIARLEEQCARQEREIEALRASREKQRSHERNIDLQLEGSRAECKQLRGDLKRLEQQSASNIKEVEHEGKLLDLIEEAKRDAECEAQKANDARQDTAKLARQVQAMKSQIQRLELECERGLSARASLRDELERARKERANAQLEHTLEMEQAVTSQREAEATLKAIEARAGALKSESSNQLLASAFEIERESMQSRIEALESQVKSLEQEREQREERHRREMTQAASSFQITAHEAFEERYQEALHSKAQVVEQYTAQLATVRKRVTQLEQMRQSERHESEQQESNLRERIKALTIMVENSAARQKKAEGEAKEQRILNMSKIKSLEAENLKLQLLKSELDAAQTAMEDSRISKSRMILQDSLDAEKRKLATAEARSTKLAKDLRNIRSHLASERESFGKLVKEAVVDAVRRSTEKVDAEWQKRLDQEMASSTEIIEELKGNAEDERRRTEDIEKKLLEASAAEASSSARLEVIERELDEARLRNSRLDAELGVAHRRLSLLEQDAKVQHIDNREYGKNLSVRGRKTDANAEDHDLLPKSKEIRTELQHLESSLDATSVRKEAKTSEKFLRDRAITSVSTTIKAMSEQMRALSASTAVKSRARTNFAIGSFSVQSPPKRSASLSTQSLLLEKDAVEELAFTSSVARQSPTSLSPKHDDAASEALKRVQRLSAQTKDLLQSLRLEGSDEGKSLLGDENGESLTTFTSATADLFGNREVSMRTQSGLFDTLAQGTSMSTMTIDRAASPPLPVRFTSLEHHNYRNSEGQSLLSEDGNAANSTYRNKSFFSENAMAHSILQSLRGREDERMRKMVHTAETEISNLTLGAAREVKAVSDADTKRTTSRTSVWYEKSFWRKRYGNAETNFTR